ncbi:multiple inositol polyphosphate phosphatase 1-like, partial [Ruditapes philippinarum]|uniref:multiple inositol polyphosphate phosphatase 1-like n=1 Tax=Ruditapes philippinarum TaxID=129788 RepID=UPI00295AEF2B
MWFVYASIILFTPHIECVGRWDVFSTNTLLQWVNSSLRHESDRIDNNINFGVSTTVCKSIHLSMVVKNGAHYPSETQMHRIKTLHEKIVKLKDPKKFVDLDNWKLRYDMNMAGELSSRGIEEITELGNRFGKMFTPVLKQDPKNEVEILSSDDQKSINSSKYFELGLSNQLINMNIHNREVNNTELNIAKHCYNFEKQQQDDSNSLKQFHLFSKTPEFMTIVNSVRRKLGMSSNLAAADLYLINEWCAYGTYISNDMTWCQLL